MFSTHHKSFLGLCAAALSSIIIYCACSAPASTDSLPETAITWPLDSLLAATFPDCDDEPGGILEVMRNDTLIYRRCFGVEDLESMRPITDSTIFNMSSASKMVSCAAIMMLAEQGRLSIEDSLSKFFPEFHSEIFDRITVRHIMTHTSGLPDLRPRSEDTWSDFLDDNTSLFANLRDFQLYGMENEHMKVFSQINNFEWEPGTHFQPFDPSLILIAPLVERVTGMKFAEWIRTNIFEPIGLPEGFYFTFGGATPASAHAYRRYENDGSDDHAYVSADGKWQEYDFGEVPYYLTQSNRGLFTSARSYMIFLRELYNGNIISRASLKQMLNPAVYTGIPNTYFGYGIGMNTGPERIRKYSHQNSNGGFSVIDCTIPEQDTHFLLFANRNDWDMWAMSAKIDSVLEADLFNSARGLE